MELTPHSTKSPKSPFRFPNTQPLYDYPSPAQSDLRYRSTDSIQGLGLFTDAMVGSTVQNGGGLETHDHSTEATNPTWPPLQHRNTPASSSSTPNILSAEYDPFAPSHPQVFPSFTHDIYSTQPAEVVGPPLLSGNTSQRSSISSTHPSEIFTQAGSIHSYTPRIKMEEPTDFCTGSDTLILSPPSLGHHGLLVTSTNSYPGSLAATYYQNQAAMGWAKIEYTNNQELPSISSLAIPRYDKRSESLERNSSGSHDQRRNSSVVARTRQPRRLTTKEDANFQCHVKGCGKLFGRSYNYKAHMETHDSTREYPFPCPMKECTKKFVRKTDLQRHHQSVHMKQRNYRCDYCSRHFARKDTLRRHMEDGCSKRFDIETVDFRPNQAFQSDDNIVLKLSSLQQPGPPQYSAPPHSSAIHPGKRTLPSSSGPYLERNDYMISGGWSN